MELFSPSPLETRFEQVRNLAVKAPMKVTYHYTGSPYTDTNAPAEPGFRLTDFIVATIELDSNSWGKSDSLAGGSITSGPFTVSCDACRITTDASGSIVGWYISGAMPGLDIRSRTEQDLIFGDRVPPHT